MKYKAILFDADGVLIKAKFLFSELLERDYGLEMRNMLPFFKGVFQDCTIGRADLREELAKVLGTWGWPGSVDELMDYWFTKGTELDGPMMEFVIKLSESVHALYVVADQERYRGAVLRQRLEGAPFKKVFFSAEIGATKNQSAYWEHVFKSISENSPAPIEKNEILYIDDGQENLNAARAFGLETYLYDGDFLKLQKLFATA
jgi:FMN phosphatase YigB (HAD superfamily)